MSRLYRSRPTQDVIRAMAEVNDQTFYLVQETGPTSFVLQNQDGATVRVAVGSSLHCSCGRGKKQHCVHTMFTLIKIFRVPPDNPLAWQIGFIDHEIDWLCKNRFNPYTPIPRPSIAPQLRRIALNDELCW
jgi:E3 ubiquitin-protein ligase ZSWIM2